MFGVVDAVDDGIPFRPDVTVTGDREPHHTSDGVDVARWWPGRWRRNRASTGWGEFEPLCAELSAEAVSG